MYFAGKKTNRRDLMKHTPQEVADIQSKVDDWFASKRRGRGSRVFFFKNDKKVWIVIRHGRPMQREGSHNDDGSTGIAFYRPQEHDVLVYDRGRDEMGINCSSSPQRTKYLETLGEVLFGDKEYFDTALKYTLDPLITLGQALAEADDFLRSAESSLAAAKSRRWLMEPASAKLLGCLGRAGIEVSPMDFGYSKYDANCQLKFHWNRDAIIRLVSGAQPRVAA